MSKGEENEENGIKTVGPVEMTSHPLSHELRPGVLNSTKARKPLSVLNQCPKIEEVNFT